MGCSKGSEHSQENQSLDAPLMQSWDNASESSPRPEPSLFDEWSTNNSSNSTKGMRHNATLIAVTTVSLGAAFFFQRKLHEYSRSRMETGHVSSVMAVSIAAPTKYPHHTHQHINRKDPISSVSDPETLMHHHADFEAIALHTLSTDSKEHSRNDNELQRSKSSSHSFDTWHSPGNNNNNNNDAMTYNTMRHQEPREEYQKYPLRTPEGQKALEKMRKIQERRRQLYDRALARQEQRDDQEQDGTPSDGFSDSNKESRIAEWQDSSLPPGTTLDEMKERARKATIGAMQAAVAAQKATAASALAAESAGYAVFAARDAADAAQRYVQGPHQAFM